MVRSRMIAAAMVFIFVGGLASGCRKQSTPPRTAPVVKRAPPGPPGGGAMVPDSEPAGPSQTGESADQNADGTGD